MNIAARSYKPAPSCLPRARSSSQQSTGSSSPHNSASVTSRDFPAKQPSFDYDAEVRRVMMLPKRLTSVPVPPRSLGSPSWKARASRDPCKDLSGDFEAVSPERQHIDGQKRVLGPRDPILRAPNMMFSRRAVAASEVAPTRVSAGEGVARSASMSSQDPNWGRLTAAEKAQRLLSKQ